MSTDAQRDAEECNKCLTCIYYFKDYPDHKCEAPNGVNRICREQFKQWKIEYITKWFPIIKG